MKKVVVIICLLMLASAAAIILVNKTFVSSNVKSIGLAVDNFFTSAFKGEIIAPPPLKSLILGNGGGTLDSAGVFADTNNARVAEGLSALSYNATLAGIAEEKLNDMFAKQYFEHTSPSGVGASDLAKKDGYGYIIIGENLAMGTFKDDQDLVDAWLASPGHRANILNTRYHELGVAVGQGIFEGKGVWIAVQEFGLSVDACPAPSPTDKDIITKEKLTLDTLQKTLTKDKAEIDAADPQSGPDYESKVQAYNVLVRQYNADVVDLKNKILKYNISVGIFNTCAQATSTPVE